METGLKTPRYKCNSCNLTGYHHELSVANLDADDDCVIYCCPGCHSEDIQETTDFKVKIKDNILPNQYSYKPDEVYTVQDLGQYYSVMSFNSDLDGRVIRKEHCIVGSPIRNQSERKQYLKCAMEANPESLQSDVHLIVVQEDEFGILLEVYMSRPAYFIGRSGKILESIIQRMANACGKEVKINIKEFSPFN